jgi:hypothetical protein
MFGRLGLLQLDTRIARLIWLTGVLLYVLAIVLGVRSAQQRADMDLRSDPQGMGSDPQGMGSDPQGV